MSVNGETEARTRVLVVEDDEILRVELCAVIDGSADFRVVDAYADGDAAAAHAEPFDLALVDLGLPGLPGADVIRQLGARHPDADFMAHTVFEERGVVFEAIVAGATSYVLKGMAPDRLLAAMRELRAGGAPMSPRIARLVVGRFQEQGTVADRYTLSGRERQILVLLEEGFTYKEVATELCVSRHTVHTHIKHIYEKLHAHGKAEALTKAKLRGIL